ncbi:hypothetical protein [Bosea sp. Root483D1]|nr:hypothetical protein [Bosea sp. Root483D1]
MRLAESEFVEQLPDDLIGAQLLLEPDHPEPADADRVGVGIFLDL